MVAGNELMDRLYGCDEEGPLITGVELSLGGEDSSLAHILVGEPVSTSPGYALECRRAWEIRTEWRDELVG
jgi:hypothetical protein